MPIPVHLITGLLGSGKTTALSHLIQQKPKNQRWLLLINEFGEVSIDDHLLATPESDELIIDSVSGGCICCTGQVALSQAMHQHLSQSGHIDRIFIEPTGLGHPAKIIDTLEYTCWPQTLMLKQIACLITPQQLTAERWKKSPVMRDLVSLADLIFLNKTDLASSVEIENAQALLAQCYPPKSSVMLTKYAKVTLKALDQNRNAPPFTILSGLDSVTHHRLIQAPQQSYASELSETQQCYLSEQNGRLLSMGWIWSRQAQFNRIKLKAFFEAIQPQILRAKGLLKTGNEWQAIQWSDGVLEFGDIAWRSDSRLELLFNGDTKNGLNPAQLETQLANCQVHRPARP